MPFFDHFPTLQYDIEKAGRRRKDTITDVFFRFKFKDAIKKRKVAYFPYIISRNETPEMIADKTYGDPSLHWIVLMVNDIVDPHTDWYMDEEVFSRFINKKYGSYATASNTIHHYLQEVSTQIIGYRNEGGRRVFSNTYSQIDATDLQTEANTTFPTVYPTIPYAAYDSMADASFEYTTTPSNQQVEVCTRRIAVSCYEWEYERNEQRQKIKLVYPETVAQIKQEFDQLVSDYNPLRRGNFRRVRV